MSMHLAKLHSSVFSVGWISGGIFPVSTLRRYTRQGIRGFVSRIVWRNCRACWLQWRILRIRSVASGRRCCYGKRNIIWKICLRILYLQNRLNHIHIVLQYRIGNDFPSLFNMSLKIIIPNTFNYHWPFRSMFECGGEMPECIYIVVVVVVWSSGQSLFVPTRVCRIWSNGNWKGNRHPRRTFTFPGFWRERGTHKRDRCSN